jgi:hypothetical protein
MAKIYTPATKSLNPWNVDDNRGWDIIGAEARADERELVPVVADCIDEIAKSMADLPFCVYNQRGEVVDDSDDYHNVTGAIPDPYSFFWLTAASLVMSGTAYWKKQRNPAGYTKGLKYWAYTNISPQIKPNTTPDNLTFRRASVSAEIPAAEVLYMWLPDPKVEFGPALSYPLKRALKSAGSLSAISSFVDNYMNSGMVKAFIAQSDVPPASDDEKREIEDYLTRILTGVKRTLSKIRVIRKTISIQSVGGGLDELRNVGVIKEIKQDVIEAFGVPASRVWGNAANYATAANDTMIFIASEIMPLARVIQSALNEQVLKPYGLTLVFEPRRMEEFAVVLGEKIAGLDAVVKSFERAMAPAEALRASIDLLGLDISPQLTERIDLAIAQSATQATASPEPLRPEPDVTSEIKSAVVELDKWQSKSERQNKIITWHAIHLPAWAVDAINGGQAWSAVRTMLLTNNAPPAKSDILALADAINRASETR